MGAVRWQCANVTPPSCAPLAASRGGKCLPPNHNTAWDRGATECAAMTPRGDLGPARVSPRLRCEVCAHHAAHRWAAAGCDANDQGTHGASKADERQRHALVVSTAPAALSVRTGERRRPVSGHVVAHRQGSVWRDGACSQRRTRLCAYPRASERPNASLGGHGREPRRSNPIVHPRGTRGELARVACARAQLSGPGGAA